MMFMIDGGRGKIAFATFRTCFRCANFVYGPKVEFQVSFLGVNFTAIWAHRLKTKSKEDLRICLKIATDLIILDQFCY